MQILHHWYKRLEHPWILVSDGVSPCGYGGLTVRTAQACYGPIQLVLHEVPAGKGLCQPPQPQISDPLIARHRGKCMSPHSCAFKFCLIRMSSHLPTGSWNLSVNSPLMWELKKNVIIKIISCFSRGFKKYRKELRRKTNHHLFPFSQLHHHLFYRLLSFLSFKDLNDCEALC